MVTHFKNNPIATPISTNQHLTKLHSALLRLHKTLLDMERRAFERIHGRVKASELLKLAIQDQQFAWLRAISEILVNIEETLHISKPVERKEAQLIISRVKKLLTPNEDSAGFARNYFLALQSDPDSVLAHRDVWDALTAAAADIQREYIRIH